MPARRCAWLRDRRGIGRPLYPGIAVDGRGWVCSEAFDHTSVLRFLETLTGVREPDISDWRRQTFGDLMSAFASGPHT